MVRSKFYDESFVKKLEAETGKSFDYILNGTEEVCEEDLPEAELEAEALPEIDETEQVTEAEEPQNAEIIAEIAATADETSE